MRLIQRADALQHGGRYSPFVRQVGTLARRLEIRWIDVAIAVGLSALALAEGSGRDSVDFSPATLLATAPLIVRRKWPVLTVLAALIGFTIAGDATNFAALVGGLIAVISVAMYWRHEILGALLTLGSAIYIALEFGRGSTSTLPIPGAALSFVLLGAAYLTGREIASRQKQLNQQRQRTALLEREHAQALKAAAETERRHIARELHDVVAHSVSVMVVQAGAARKVMHEKPAAALDSLLAVEASGHEAMGELRRLLGVLSENGGTEKEAAPLAPQPGVDSLDALVARVREAGLPVEMRIDGERPSIPPGVDVAVYRIVQEALTNALKYAGGARTEVVLRYEPNAIDVEVLDEGMVATPADGIGRGLVGMQERVALFGGKLLAGKRPERGYAVRAYLPLTSSE
jgi:signal transduction histidine kinase